MSATDEEIKYIENVGLDHVTYVLILFRQAENLKLLTNHVLLIIDFFLWQHRICDLFPDRFPSQLLQCCVGWKGE